MPPVRVLLVDDQVTFRRAAARVLARMPCFVLVGEACSGEAAVISALHLQPDLVLMDVLALLLVLTLAGILYDASPRLRTRSATPRRAVLSILEADAST